MKLLILLLVSAIKVASYKDQIINAHPDCQQTANITIKYPESLICVNDHHLFRDEIFKGGFE